MVNCSSQQQNYNVKAFISIIMSFITSDRINLWVASTRLVRFNSLTFKFNYNVFKYVNVWFSYPLRAVLLKYLLQLTLNAEFNQFYGLTNDLAPFPKQTKMAAKSAIWRPSLFGEETHLVLWCILMSHYGQIRTNKDILGTGTHTREIYDAADMVLVIFS